MLGTLFARLDDEDEAAAALGGLGDLLLMARVAETGARFDETPGEYVASGVRRFAARAGDEAWMALTTAMERAEDPRAVALRRMIEWSLESDASGHEGCGGGCGCGGGAP